MIEEKFEYDCSQGLIDQNAFPITNWKRALQESILTYENALFTKEDPQGEFALREHISTYLYHSRGVHSSPDQIVIGAGTQPLLWLLLQLLGPTKEYGIENPGFHRIHAIIKSCDRQIHPIPLDEKGLIFLVYTIQIPMSPTLHHHTNFHSGLLCLYLED